MIPKFKAKNVNGELFITDKDMFGMYLSTQPEDVEILVRKPSSMRSLNQNRYFFGVVVKTLSEHLGYAPDEIHNMLKSKFLSQEVEVNDEKYLFTRSTADLNTEQFELYLSDIRSWASTEKCWIPLPNEVETY